MLARGGNIGHKNSPNKDIKDVSTNSKKKNNTTSNSQAEDFDFWSMPQN